jgi:hypothetical protein
MTRKKSQKELCLEVLKANPNKWLPAWYFVGERNGINGKVFLSYKAPARLSDLWRERNYPEIIREMTTGVTGTDYFQYKYVNL